MCVSVRATLAQPWVGKHVICVRTLDGNNNIISQKQKKCVPWKKTCEVFVQRKSEILMTVTVLLPSECRADSLHHCDP